MSRHDIRKQAFELLFAQQINNYAPDEIIEIIEDFDEEKVNKDVKLLFLAVLTHKDELDEIITKFSQKRSIARIPKSALSLIRIALYEILHDEKVPTSVAINEAVLLAKEYCDDGDVAFVNGLLGAYSRSTKENV